MTHCANPQQSLPRPPAGLTSAWGVVSASRLVCAQVHITTAMAERDDASTLSDRLGVAYKHTKGHTPKHKIRQPPPQSAQALASKAIAPQADSF